MPKISVIIPVYNAQNYIERCLDSVVNQTLKDIEILCIDDCSADNSLDILNSYAQKDSRIKVFANKTNLGESAARNVGLENVTGEYIAFVDNDDKIDLNFYEKLYQKAIETDADIVKGNVETTSCDGTVSESSLNPKIAEFNNKWYFHYEWWSAIYKKSIIKDNNIKLPEGYILGGDCLFLNEVLPHCQNLQLVNDVYYHWLRRPDSGESKILSEAKVTSALKIFDKILGNNNQLYINNKIDAASYDLITKNCMWIPIEYVFRNSSKASTQECAEYMIKFYKKCMRKAALEQHIISSYASLYKKIKGQNLEALIAYLETLTDKKVFSTKNMIATLRLKREVAYA